MRNLNLSCPRCGTAGKVRIDELDLQFRCKTCNAKFHVDSTGKCVLGNALRKQEGVFDATPRKASWWSDPLGPVIVFVTGLPYNVRLVTAALIFLGLSFGVFRWATAERLEPLPSGLLDRTDFVVREFVENDIESICRLASPGGTRPLKLWLEEKRPEYWSYTGDQVKAHTKVVYQNARTGVGCVVATLYTTEPPAAGTTPGAPKQAPLAKPSSDLGPGERSLGVDLLLFWILGSDGEWLLDGEKVLKGS